MIASTCTGPRLDSAPLVRRGDVVTFSRKHGRATKVYYVRVARQEHRARYSAACREWLTFTGRRLRPYDHAVAIGPEASYAVAAGELTVVYRQPVTFRRLSLADLREARPWHTAS